MPALELGGISLGLREGVVLLIVLVTVYMVFVLLRMRRLRQPALPVPVMIAPSLATDSTALNDTAELDKISAEIAGTDPEAAWSQASVGLTNTVLLQSVEQELAQLRDEVDSIRGELAALRSDMLQQVAHLQSAQSVSPIYGDAMQMAVAGYDPVMIADRCGIARAEAELVVALAKSQGQQGQ